MNLVLKGYLMICMLVCLKDFILLPRSLMRSLSEIWKIERRYDVLLESLKSVLGFKSVTWRVKVSYNFVWKCLKLIDTTHKVFYTHKKIIIKSNISFSLDNMRKSLSITECLLYIILFQVRQWFQTIETYSNFLSS